MIKKALFSLSAVISINSAVLLAQVETIKGVIDDPSIKKVCNELTSKREEKKNHRQALLKLHKKTSYLLSRSDQKQKKVQTSLQRISDKIEFEIKVTNSKIETLAEKIIRSGCPPIDLEGQRLDEIATKEIVNNTSKDVNIEDIDLKSIEEAANDLLQ